MCPKTIHKAKKTSSKSQKNNIRVGKVLKLPQISLGITSDMSSKVFGRFEESFSKAQSLQPRTKRKKKLKISYFKT